LSGRNYGVEENSRYTYRNPEVIHAFHKATKSSLQWVNKTTPEKPENVYFYHNSFRAPNEWLKETVSYLFLFKEYSQDSIDSYTVTFHVYGGVGSVPSLSVTPCEFPMQDSCIWGCYLLDFKLWGFLKGNDFLMSLLLIFFHYKLLSKKKTICSL
jgi:hypothetical protein